MAKLRIGPPGGEMSGALGGLVYSRNSYGPYVRTRTTPTNPDSPLQQTRRNAFQQVAGFWTANLSAAMRSGWAEYAAQISWLDSLGQTIRLSGFNHFMRLNTLKLLAGMVIQSDAPILPVLPDTPSLMNLTPDVDEVSVSFASGDAWATEVGSKLMVWASDDYPASKSYLPNRFRYIGAVAGAATPPTSPVVLTPSPFPWTYSAGQKVKLYARLLRLEAGVTEPVNFTYQM